MYHQYWFLFLFFKGFDMLRAFVFTTGPTIAGSPWQVSQGSSCVIAALSLRTGIIRCTFNKPWSQIGILSYTPINNGWTGQHCLWLLRSQMSNINLETINVSEAEYQQRHKTQGQKFIVEPPGAKFLQLRQHWREQQSFHRSCYDMNNGVQFFVLAGTINQP